MKRYLSSFFAFILMFIFMESVSAKGNVEITNASISDKTSNVVAKITNYKELTLNAKESFYEVGDYVTYKVTIKNNTDESLPVEDISDNLKNEYIETSYNFEKKEIKSNEEYSFYVSLKYKKEITDSSVNLNIPIDIIINYENGKSTTIIVNPDTKDNIIIYFIIFVLSAISLVLFKNKKKVLLVFVLALLLIPSIGYAVNNKIVANMDNEIGIYKRLAIMRKGTEVNRILKTLAGDNINTSDNPVTIVDSNIKHIVRATELPSNVNLTDNNKISTADSVVSVYAWYDNGTIYYYSDSEVIYLNEDSSYLFRNLSKLEDIDTSLFDTSNVSTFRHMFYGCNSLKEINLNSFDTSNATSLRGMFYNCSSLKELDVSKFKTDNVVEMNFMFYGCSSLKKIDVTKFNTKNVTSMKSMFYNCTSLTELDISNFNTSKVEDMSFMFKFCTGLKSIDVSNFDTSNVTNMNSMFSGTDSIIMNLENIIGLDKFDTSKVTNMRSMFSGCAKMKTIDVSKFDTSNVTDFAAMFHDCTSLETLDVSNFNTSKAIYLDHMFNICSSKGNSDRLIYSNLKFLDLTNFDTTNVETIDYFLESLKYVSAEITIRSTKLDITDIENVYKGAFSDAALYDGSKIVINYTKDTETIVDALIATKSARGNVVKGKLVE